jgi:hypothetical protein
MRTGVLSLIFAVLAVGCLSTAADARPNRSGDGQSLDQILPQIREKHPGTLYDAEGPFTGPDGRRHYRIKWGTPEGRVIWFDADAHTGRVTGAGERRDRDFYDGQRGDRFNDGEDRARRANRDNDDRPRRGNRFNDDGLGGNPFGDDRPHGRRNNNDGWGPGGPGGWRDGPRGNPDGGRRRGNDGGFGGFGNGNGGNRGHRH